MDLFQLYEIINVVWSLVKMEVLVFDDGEKYLCACSKGFKGQTCEVNVSILSKFTGNAESSTETFFVANIYVKMEQLVMKMTICIIVIAQMVFTEKIVKNVSFCIFFENAEKCRSGNDILFVWNFLTELSTKERNFYIPIYVGSVDLQKLV